MITSAWRTWLVQELTERLPAAAPEIVNAALDRIVVRLVRENELEVGPGLSDPRQAWPPPGPCPVPEFSRPNTMVSADPRGSAFRHGNTTGVRCESDRHHPPAARNCSAMASNPLAWASCSGVIPLASTIFGSAPAASRMPMIS